MATTHFENMPNVALPRTKMGVNFTHPTTFLHGRVVPIFNCFVQPGDSFKLDLSALIRLSSPVAPIFGNIELKAHSFFIPMRLVWDHTPEFFGENTESAGPQTNQFTIPAASYGKDSIHTAKLEGVSHYLGKPLRNAGGYIDAAAETINVSVLYERAYWLVISEYYRRQQLENPILIETGDDGFARVDDYHISGGVKVADHIFDRDCWITSKKDDYFTSATVAPQYSADPVTLPLGEYAPLITMANPDDTSGLWSVGTGDGGIIRISSGAATNNLVRDLVSNETSVGSTTGRVYTRASTGDVVSVPAATYTNLVADLSNAVAANVNEIRLAFATQRFLERDNFGTLYPQLIKSHFGVTSSLSILQRPQLLYKASQWINIQQVLSTNGATAGDLGKPGANSVTAFKAPIVHNAFDEFGFILVLIETKFNRLYCQGIDRFDLKRTKWDFYFPEFATIGDQAISQAEIYAQYDANNYFNGSDVFGYQEAWAEYRYFRDRVSGRFDPSAANSSFIYWTLADFLGAGDVDGINSTFIKEDRTPLTRALATGVGGPDYYGDFAITGTMIRTMPLYSIPGLVDHVGGR